MKKYKNVKAIKARKCDGFYIHRDGRRMIPMCIGVREPFNYPTCNGYKCKCTEYKYDEKRGVHI